jgi:hypothetical protein
MFVHRRKLGQRSRKGIGPRMMMERIGTIAIAVGLLSVAFSGSAAQETVVKAGATIRFQIDSTASTHSAELARLTSDSLFLSYCATCNRLLYSRAEVSRLAVLRVESRGDRMIAGLAIGTLVGGGLGYLLASNCNNGDTCDLAALDVPIGAIFGGLVGTAAGLFSAYKWTPVTLDAR